jgi:hypothetical protein
MAGAILVEGPQPGRQKPPVNHPRQLGQRVIDIDDLIQPRAQKILLAAVTRFPGSHRRLQNHSESGESRNTAPDQIPRNPATSARIPARSNHQKRQKFKSFPMKSFPMVVNSSRSTSYATGKYPIEYWFILLPSRLISCPPDSNLSPPLGWKTRP